MPSTKKRINLTVPDSIYEQLQSYKKESGLENDATACLQLIVKQLNAHSNGKVLLHMMQSMSPEQMMQMSKEGLCLIQEELNAKT